MATNTFIGENGGNWGTDASWSLGTIPAAGEDVTLGNKTGVVMNVARIPATGALKSLTATSGYLTVVTTSGTKGIFVTTITGGNTINVPLIQFSGTNTVTIGDATYRCAAKGGSATGAYAFDGSSPLAFCGSATGSATNNAAAGQWTGTGTATIAAQITGGSSTSSVGLKIWNGGQATINEGPIVGGYAAGASGLAVSGVGTRVTCACDIEAGTWTGTAPPPGVDNTANTAVIATGNLINKTTGSAINGMVDYRPAAGKYVQYPNNGSAIKYPVQLAASVVLLNTVHGDRTGTLVSPTVFDVRKAVAYGPGGNGATGTLCPGSPIGCSFIRGKA